MGIIVGELFNLFVLLKLTQDLPNHLKFQSVSVFLLILAILVCILIKEPIIYSADSKQQSFSD